MHASTHLRAPVGSPLAGRGPMGRAAAAAPRRVARAAVNTEQLAGAYTELLGYIQSKSCNPIIVRLAWHDSGTFNKAIQAWPQRGGANAAIRFQPELGHGHNAGLNIAINLLKPIKAKFPDVSYADLFQMASAAAVEAAGGPKLAMRYGRKDVPDEAGCANDGLLPAAMHPFPDGSLKPADHLRKVFNRMGFNDQEIVVLSGGHTLGRARKDRSGLGTEASKYTKDGPGIKGGQSWTPDWLVFNNSYFTEVRKKIVEHNGDPELLVMDTDACIFQDEGFRPHAELYAADQPAFFKDYAVAHVKLSELGVEWEAGAPVTI